MGPGVCTVALKGEEQPHSAAVKAADNSSGGTAADNLETTVFKTLNPDLVITYLELHLLSYLCFLCFSLMAYAPCYYLRCPAPCCMGIEYVVPTDHCMVSGIQPIPFYHNILMKNMVY